MNSDKHILITGSTGLIGSHIVLELIKHSCKMSLLCRNISSAELELKQIFSWYNLDFSSYADRITILKGDLLDLGSIEDAMKGVNYVIHAAAMVSTKKSDRDMMLKVNAEGTANLVNIANMVGVKKFIHLSSVSTLGRNPDGLIDEDYFFKPDPSTSAYAISKYASEQEVWRSVEEGLSAIIFNPSFVIGPSLRKNSSASIYYAVRDGLPAYVEGRSGYVSAQDVAKACVLSLDAELKPERFILSAKNMNTLDFLTIISSSLKKAPPKRKLKRVWFPVVILLSKLNAMINKEAVSLSKDSLRMASNKNSFDGSRVTNKLSKFTYSNIEVSIQNTADIILNFS
ncbi:MAG: NAD-dependent epimerase/dehydratase family protein [Bacteroidia bacterium]